MATSPPVLKPVTQGGWRAGLANLLHKEANTWLRTRYGLIHLVLWIFIINGLMAIIISTAGEDLDAGETVVAASIDPFVGIAAWFTSIGVAILAMGAIVGEKSSGTAAWVLSAPVSRPAFLLSKLLVIGVGSVVTMIVIPGLLVFVEFSYIPAAAESGEVAIVPWLGALGALSLNVLFYLGLTVFLGTLFSSRGAVIGTAIGVFMAGTLIAPVLPSVVSNLTPWALLDPLAMALADETRSVDSIVPVFAAMAWIAIFTVAAFWRFQREEF